MFKGPGADGFEPPTSGIDSVPTPQNQGPALCPTELHAPKFQQAVWVVTPKASDVNADPWIRTTDQPGLIGLPPVNFWRLSDGPAVLGSQEIPLRPVIKMFRFLIPPDLQRVPRQRTRAR